MKNLKYFVAALLCLLFSLSAFAASDKPIKYPSLSIPGIPDLYGLMNFDGISGQMSFNNNDRERLVSTKNVKKIEIYSEDKLDEEVYFDINGRLDKTTSYYESSQQDSNGKWGNVNEASTNIFTYDKLGNSTGYINPKYPKGATIYAYSKRDDYFVIETPVGSSGKRFVFFDKTGRVHKISSKFDNDAETTETVIKYDDQGRANNIWNSNEPYMICQPTKCPPVTQTIEYQGDILVVVRSVDKPSQVGYFELTKESINKYGNFNGGKQIDVQEKSKYDIKGNWFLKTYSSSDGKVFHSVRREITYR